MPPYVIDTSNNCGRPSLPPPARVDPGAGSCRRSSPPPSPSPQARPSRSNLTQQPATQDLVRCFAVSTTDERDNSRYIDTSVPQPAIGPAGPTAAQQAIDLCASAWARGELVMLIGGDRTGRLLEVGVAEADGIEFIVHAMPARPRFLR